MRIAATLAIAAFVIGITATVTTRDIHEPADDCRTIKNGHVCNATPACDWPDIYWRGPPGREYCHNVPGKIRTRIWQGDIAFRPGSLP